MSEREPILDFRPSFTKNLSLLDQLNLFEDSELQSLIIHHHHHHRYVNSSIPIRIMDNSIRSPGLPNYGLLKASCSHSVCLMNSKRKSTSM